jgi:hypothetical protein
MDKHEEVFMSEVSRIRVVVAWPIMGNLAPKRRLGLSPPRALLGRREKRITGYGEKNDQDNPFQERHHPPARTCPDSYVGLGINKSWEWVAINVDYRISSLTLFSSLAAFTRSSVRIA